MAFALITGIQSNTSYEQCLELPRVIATIDGRPVKEAKSNTTKVQKLYENVIPPPPFVSISLKPRWIPDTVVMEGMFLINITPWSAHQNIGDYVDFLIKQHILPHFETSQEKYTYFLTIQNVKYEKSKVFRKTASGPEQPSTRRSLLH